MHKTESRVLLGLIVISCILLILFILSLPPIPDISWKEYNYFLLLVSITFAVTIFFHAVITFSFRDAMLLFIISMSVTVFAEYTGARYGIPFGVRYDYNVYLTPRFAGIVPLFIPLSWFVLIYIPIVLFRNFLALDRPNKKIINIIIRSLLCSSLLVSFDLFLDPLAVHAQIWAWHEEGVYFGVPLLNYLGWFIVGFICYLIFFSMHYPVSRHEKFHILKYDAALVVLSIVITLVANLFVIIHLDTLLPTLLTLITSGLVISAWVFFNGRRLLAVIK